MSVEELIRLLQKVDDKRKQVFVFVENANYDIFVASSVDELTDRVDINCVENK